MHVKELYKITSHVDGIPEKKGISEYLQGKGYCNSVHIVLAILILVNDNHEVLEC